MSVYNKRLIDNATKNYNRFEEDQLNSTIESVYTNASQIIAYNEMEIFLLKHEEYLDDSQVKFLVSKSDKVIDFLYSVREILSLSNADNIYTLIEIETDKAAKMNYREQLSKNAEVNYIAFAEEELVKSKQEIFDNAYKIAFFSELHNYLTGSHELEDHICSFLCEDGESVIDLLYKEYLDNEHASIASWDDVYDFISLYNETYNPNHEEHRLTNPDEYEDDADSFGRKPKTEIEM